MQEILTKSGAVLHVDMSNPDQALMVPGAAALLGGVVSQMEVSQ